MTTLTQEKITLKKSEMEIYANYRCHGDILMASAKGIDLNRYSSNLEELWEF